MTKPQNVFSQLHDFLVVLNTVAESNETKPENDKLSPWAMDKIAECFEQVQKTYVYISTVSMLISGQINENQFSDQLFRRLEAIELEWQSKDPDDYEDWQSFQLANHLYIGSSPLAGLNLVPIHMNTKKGE